MKKIFAIILCAGLSVSLIACQNTGNDDVSTDKQQSSVTENNSTTAEGNASDLDNNTSASQEVELNEYGLPVNAESMLPVLQAMIVTDEQTDYEYAIGNNGFIWYATELLIGTELADGLNIEVKDSYAYASADTVKVCVNAMFAGFDSNQEALPELVEAGTVVYDEAADTYGFLMSHYGEQSIEVTDCQVKADGSLRISVAYYADAEKSEPEDTYVINMTQSSHETDEEAIFAYMVTSFNQVEKESDTVDVGEGQITQEQALAIIEDKYGVNGEPETETGNIITYGFEEITTLESGDYYNFRMSWLVVNDEGIPDHSSYLQNFFVSMDGSTILMGYRGADGEWEIMEE